MPFYSSHAQARYKINDYTYQVFLLRNEINKQSRLHFTAPKTYG